MITIKTTQYQFSHGKKPRGFGVWAFGIQGETYFTTPMKYSAAMQDACKMATLKKATEIEVLP